LASICGICVFSEEKLIYGQNCGDGGEERGCGQLGNEIKYWLRFSLKSVSGKRKELKSDQNRIKHGK
jgi:hypothetical protein